MYEAPEPPKKEIPYPWIVAGLSALSLSLLIITVTDAFEASKKEDMLAASRAEASAKESAMKSKIEAMAAEHAAAVRANGQRYGLRGIDVPREMTIPKVDRVMTGEHSVSRKPLLLAEALHARDEGNLLRAKSKFEEILAIDPEDMGAKEGLASTMGALAEASNGVTAGSSWDVMNKQFLAKLNFEKSVAMTASGLRYKIISYGSGPKPNTTSTVKCRYEGKFIDGIVFDSTAKRNNEPSEFPLDAVIPAWTEGLQHIGVGGKIILYAPPSLAYGSRRAGPIPPDSVLIFEVELVGITK
jgi:FKBP-type peptidyl-prolyl cis-trans isomerase